MELQARARAIRSQLALEPVTKIELKDSDGEDVVEIKEATIQPEKTAKETQPVAAPIPRPELEQIVASSSTEPVVRPVRLKRNFRQRKPDEADDDGSNETPAENKPVESASVPVNETATKDDAADAPIQNDKEKQNEKEKERSPSPDVIPIVKEPEVLYISSGDESENEDKSSYIKLPVVAKEKGPETEDEIFLRKLKEGAASTKNRSQNESDDASVSKSANVDDGIRPSGDIPTKDNDKNAQDIANEKEKDQEPSSTTVSEPAVPPEPAKEPEPLEDGEILDDDDEPVADTTVEIVNLDDDSNSSHSSSSSSSSTGSSSGSSQSSASEKPEENKEKVAEPADEDVEMKNADAVDANISTEADIQNISIEKPTVVEDEEDADIIDLGKDEDLDFDMSCDSKSPPKKRKTESDEQPKQSNDDVSGIVFKL